MAWITVKEARSRLSNAVSLQTLYRVAHSGDVKTTRLRGRILLEEESFGAFLTRAGLRMIQPAATTADDKECCPARSAPKREKVA